MMENGERMRMGGKTGKSGKGKKSGLVFLTDMFSFRVAAIGKWLVVVLILGYVALLLWFTGGSTKPFEEVAQAVESQLDTENLVKRDVQALKRYFGLNGADYAGVLYYSSEFSISAEEVLIIEAEFETQVQEIRDAVEARLESRKENFSDYAPKQAMMIEQAAVLVRGKYVFVAVSPDAERYADVFRKSL